MSLKWCPNERTEYSLSVAKQFIDSIANTLFESGIHNQQEQRLLAKPLNLFEDDLNTVRTRF